LIAEAAAHLLFLIVLLELAISHRQN
jgi:hypothetical protein